MNMPVITALTTTVPDCVPLSRWRDIEVALRLAGPSGWQAWVASWRLGSAGCPGGPAYTVEDTIRIEDENFILPDEVPVEPDTDLSGLAARAARMLCCRRHPDAPPVDVVMFCHSSLNEHVSTTTAGRLRAVLDTPCFPFSVSQQQGASFFTSLRLAMDLMVAEPAVCTILIVAAEKWCPPFSRWAGPWGLHGDAAGALLVERARAATHGLRLIDACTRTLGRFDPSQLYSPQGVHSIWAPALRSMIDAMLARHDLRRSSIPTIIGHQVNPQMAAAISHRLGLKDSGYVARARAYLGAAESIVRLAATAGEPGLSTQGIVLAWGIGLGGYVACALLERQGAPAVYMHVGRDADANQPS
jgi:3-oxoacyl-[acyl-carrier-protein] synthase III